MLNDVMYYAEGYVYKLLVKAFFFTLDGYWVPFGNTWIHPPDFVGIVFLDRKFFL